VQKFEGKKKKHLLQRMSLGHPGVADERPPVAGQPGLFDCWSVTPGRRLAGHWGSLPSDQGTEDFSFMKT
jgi:hypothetical protein